MKFNLLGENVTSLGMYNNCTACLAGQASFYFNMAVFNCHARILGSIPDRGGHETFSSCVTPDAVMNDIPQLFCVYFQGHSLCKQ